MDKYAAIPVARKTPGACTRKRVQTPPLAGNAYGKVKTVATKHASAKKTINHLRSLLSNTR